MSAGRSAARPASTLGVGLACLLLVAGLLAGFLNRNVLSGSRFAGHVDELRRDPAVARQIGEAITDRVLTTAPDLIAVRPLLESSATALAASPAFTPVVRAAARQLHRAFTSATPEQVVLRLADVGAVLTGVIRVVAPQVAARLPPDLDVTLARVGQQSFAATTIRWTRTVGVLAWLLPVLALLAAAVGWGFAPSFAVGMRRTGRAVVAAGALTGLFGLVGATAAARADEDTLHGALVAGTWRQAHGEYRWTVVVPLVAGGLLLAAAPGPRTLPLLPGRIRSTSSPRPERGRASAWRGIALVAFGLFAVLQPALVLSVLGVAVGLLALVLGLGELLPQPRPQVAGEHRHRPPGRRSPLFVLGVATVLVVGLVVVDAAPVRRAVSAGQLAPGPAVAACNGHVELCGRRYDQVAFPATHNAMSAADERGWFIPEQPTGLVGQLDAGIRVLLVDSWYGRQSARPGLVTTAPGSHDAALAEADRQFGSAAVASALRLADAGRPAPVGPVHPYLCHGLCEIGSTDWVLVMTQVRDWLVAHPREVVTFFVEDAVSPADTAAVFQQAGLLPFVHTQQQGQPWPTLEQMIDSGRRVVVQMERHSGGARYPWLLPGFTWTQDTPYANPTAADLSCVRERGSASSPLLLVNYWLSNNFGSLVTDAQKINRADVMAPYLARCRRERGRIPNYVAVNFYDIGDVFRVVDQLNGFPT